MRERGKDRDAPPTQVNSKRLILKGSGDDSRHAQESILQAVQERHFDASCCFAVRLALEEAISNAFKHGNKNDPSKKVTLEYRVDDETIEIAVADEGEGFDPTAVPDPTDEQRLEMPTGRGIVLMKSFMSEVLYEPPGNRVRMVFKKGTKEAGA